MAYHVELHLAGKTDAGLLRAHNEDSIVVNAGHGFAILADGMGGYNAGEVASDIATVVLAELLEDRLQVQGWDLRPSNRSSHIHTLIVEAINKANESILELAQNEPQYSGMGTTLVMALFHYDKVTIAHIGDSRAYRFRQGVIEQITRDHSLVQEQIDAGLVSAELAQFSHNKNLITRALGIAQQVEADIHEYPTEVGDIYLLCSDGLTDMVSRQEIYDIVNTAGADLEAACNTLIDRANAHGGRDNISAILVKVQHIDTEAEGLFGRILHWMK